MNILYTVIDDLTLRSAFDPQSVKRQLKPYFRQMNNLKSIKIDEIL